MSNNERDKMIYRCPYCFNLANDVYLHKDGDSYYCLRCSFQGDLKKIQQLYNEFKARYISAGKRVTLEEQRQM